jgi:transposase
MHQVHNSINGYAWQFKGSRQTKKIMANTGRRRVNIIGGVNAVTMKVSTLVTGKNCDKSIIIEYLKKLRQQYPQKNKIYMILDNATYNRSKEVKAIAKSCNIELVYLPPYCPNLNLIERLWKYFKKEVVQNKYYEQFEEFETFIIAFFQDIHERIDDLTSLLNFKFGIIKAI